MKKRILLTLFCAFYSITIFASPDQSILESLIQRVTVYRQGALLTRTADVKVKAGNDRIVIAGSSETIDPNTARVRSIGDFEIISIAHQYDFLAEMSPNEEVSGLLKRKSDLENELHTEQVFLEVAREELKYLNGEVVSKGDESRSVSELESMMKFFKEKMRNVKLEILEINKRIEQLKKEVSLIDMELKQIQKPRQKVSQFVIETWADSDQSGSVEISYWGNGASWESTYDIRVKDLKDPVLIQSNASIMNQTGEDWSDVALTLSTGNPWRSMTKPAVQTWWLDFLQNYPMPIYGQAEKKDMMLNMRSKMSTMDEVVVIDGLSVKPTVAISENMTTMEFKVSGTRDIPTSNQPISVRLDQNEMTANYQYYAAPSHSPHAFLTANIKDWASFNFSKGTASVYFEDTYIGKTLLDPALARDSLEISLGPDIAVHVSKKKSKDIDSRKWFNTKQTETKGFDIVVTNQKPTEVEVIIVDRIPVAINENIEVELLKAEGADLNEETGLLTWKEKISSGGLKNLSFVFEVKYPKGKELALGR